jgi:hypothetical protein
VGIINTLAEPVSVQAHIKGIVTDLIPYYGAVIETPATVVRGVFGMGGEQHGVLKVVVTGNDEPVTHSSIDARVTYALVLGGSEVTADALHRMIELGARGVIAGSIRSAELQTFLGYASSPARLTTGFLGAPASPAGSRSVASRPWRLGASTMDSNGWSFPPIQPGIPSPLPPDFVIVITEGFGSVPMSPRTFELLAAHDGQEIAIDGATRLRWGLARPEIIIPLSRTTAVKWLDEAGPKLEVGTHVRLLSPDYLGQVGQIAGLPIGPRAAQSGVVTPVVDVVLPNDRRLRVPVVDLEVLE